MTSTPPAHPIPNRPFAWLTFDRFSLVLMGGVLFSLLLAFVVISLLANPDARTPLDRFVPTTPGTTLVYQVTMPDGSQHYQTSNIGRSVGNDALVIIGIDASSELIRRLRGREEITEEDTDAVLENQSGRIKVARLIETTYTPTTTLQIASSFFLLRSNQAELISTGNQNFLPFVPFYDGDLAEGSSLSSSGTYGVGSPYSATLTFEAVEAVETPLQRFESCQRFLLTVDITDLAYNQLRSWFCEGVGLVQQETTYNHADAPIRMQLIATHIGGENRAGEMPPLSAAPAPTPLPVAEPGTEWERIWSFNDGSRQRRDIATQVVSAGDLYLYGDEEGHLIAIDRNSHLLVWRFQTGNAIYATPVVADGVVYVGSADGTLYALEICNGAFRWAFTAKDLLSAPPTVADGTVYFGSEDSTLYALDAQTGQEVWRYEAGGPIAAKLMVADGTLYVGVDDGGLYALDRATGAEQWIFPSDAGISAGAAIMDNLLYTGNVAGWVYALRRDTTLPEGEVVWAFETDDAITSDLLVHNGLLYVTIPNTLYAFEPQTGKVVWQFESEFAIQGPPLVFGNSLFVNLGRTVAMVEASTGEVIARIDSGSPQSETPLNTDGSTLLVGHIDGTLSVHSSTFTAPWRSEAEWVATDLTNDLSQELDALSTPPVLYNDELLYVSTYGRIYRVNRSSGASTLLGDVEIELAYLPPLVVGDTLIVGNFFGNLTGFNLQTNAVEWEVDLNNATFTSAYSDGERVLWAATVEDQLVAYAFDPLTGESVWEQALPYTLAATPASIFHNGTFYVVGDSLTALEPATGEILWQSAESYRPLFLTAMGDSVYAMAITDDFDTLLVGWDVNSHSATTVIPYTTDSLPALFGGVSSGSGIVVLASETGDLTAIDVENETIRWQVQNGHALQGVPIITDSLMLYSSADNHLHARQLSDGTLIGDFAAPLTAMTPIDVDGSMAPLLVNDRLYMASYQESYTLQLR